MKEYFIDRFKDFCLSNQLLKKGDTVLVSFSGGADSTALLYAVWKLRTKLNLKIIALHINYHLRGEDSNLDEESAKNFSFSLGVPIIVKNCPIDEKTSIEERARSIRETIYKNLSKMYKLDKIALGHNKDDQAETILFKLFRGAGITGIKGILPKNGKKIHPLLPFDRMEIRDFLNEIKITWRDDVSNNSSIYNRNKIRLELIPWIKKNINSNIIERLYHSAMIFQKSDNYLRNEANKIITKLQLKSQYKGIQINLDELKKIDELLRFYIFRNLYQRITKQEVNFYNSHFLEIESILNSNGTKELNLPNSVLIIKDYNSILFIKEANLHSISYETKEVSTIRAIQTYGKYRVGMKKMKKLPKQHNVFGDKNRIFIDLDKVEFPLYFRTRKNGDKFIPYGMKNFKKLKDFFIDEKIPKLERDKILIITDSNKIIWIAGYRADNRVAITKGTTNILQITIDKIIHTHKRAAKRKK